MREKERGLLLQERIELRASEVTNVDTRPVNVLSVCSGYGGIELGLHAALGGRSRTVAYVENELSVASILAARMEDGSLDSAPIWTDLRTFDPEPWRGKVDILAGGFPCQPHSVAGSQLGEDDPRELSGEVLRIAAGLGYPTLFLENVPGILRFYWDSIRPELREMGYQVAEGLFTAAETGAPHRRERLFILAHTAGRRVRAQPGSLGTGPTSESRQRSRSTEEPIRRGSELAHAEEYGVQEPRSTHQSQSRYSSSSPISGDAELADAAAEGLQGIRPRGSVNVNAGCNTVPLYPPGPNDREGWAHMLTVMPEALPTFCRDADGAATKVGDQLRALGNGVIPAVAATAYRELSEAIGGERYGG